MNAKKSLQKVTLFLDSETVRLFEEKMTVSEFEAVASFFSFTENMRRS